MLNIYLGDGWNDREDVIMATAVYFNNIYEDDWIEDPFTKKRVLDIDETEIVNTNMAISPVLGGIPITDLSGGVKTLILINNDPTHIYNASQCGDNCAKWLLEIGRAKDITVRLGYIMEFDEDVHTEGKHVFDIRIVNTDTVVHNQREFDHVCIELGV